ncbi:MAG: CDP-glucose 4,6-dehydratase [bacterium]
MNFWQDKRVFITGHTGFKGAWLSLWLNLLGAKVTGYALKPPTTPNLFEFCELEKKMESIIADIRDLDKLKREISKAKPEIVIHMAAQPIVRESYKVPVETFSINVMGTVNMLEAVRSCEGIKAVVNVTTDKVYEVSNVNRVTRNAYSEEDPLGGHDPYSSSKACSELVSQAYQRSYGMNIATARAGNVIGGGDWAADRLVPDFFRAVLAGKKMMIRNPNAVRPWQHVLEPLHGYLLLAEKLYCYPSKYDTAWNFGPKKKDIKTVEWVINSLCKGWGQGASYEVDGSQHPHEADYLCLDNSKAKKSLGWRPKWDLETAMDKVIEWTKASQSEKYLKSVCLEQIKEYIK